MTSFTDASISCSSKEAIVSLNPPKSRARDAQLLTLGEVDPKHLAAIERLLGLSLEPGRLDCEDDLLTLPIRSDQLVVLPLRSSNEDAVAAKLLESNPEAASQTLVIVCGRGKQTLPSDSLLKQLESAGATILWETTAFLTHRIAGYKASHLGASDHDIAEGADISVATLKNHQLKNHHFVSRTWTGLVDVLGITDKEACLLVDADVRGPTPKERQIYIQKIEQAIARLVQSDPASDLTVRDILDETLRQEAQGGLDWRDRNTLVPLIAETARRVLGDNFKEDLYREILDLDSALRKLSHSELTEMLRSQQLGLLFEELALISFQTKPGGAIPQYCLSVKRDAAGKVVHTTDIVDFVASDHETRELEIKAVCDERVRSGQFHLSVSGSYSLSRDGLEFEGVDAKGQPVSWSEPGSFLSSEIKGRFFQYRDPSSGAEYRVRIGDDIAENVLRHFSVDGNDVKAVETFNDRVGNALPFVACELKRAGGKSVSAIKRQLRQQRDRILTARKERPDSIDGKIAHIRVFSLNKNIHLQKAITELNKEIPFIMYRHFNPALEVLPIGMGRQLEHCTLEEVVALRKLCHRVNEVLALEPGVQPLKGAHAERLLLQSRLTGGKESSLNDLCREIESVKLPEVESIPDPQTS